MPRRGRGSVRNEREEPLRTFAWQMRTPARGQRSITPGAFRSQLGPDLRLRLTRAGAVGERSRCCPSPVSEKAASPQRGCTWVIDGLLIIEVRPKPNTSLEFRGQQVGTPSNIWREEGTPRKGCSVSQSHGPPSIQGGRDSPACEN